MREPDQRAAVCLCRVAGVGQWDARTVTGYPSLLVSGAGVKAIPPFLIAMDKGS